MFQIIICEVSSIYGTVTINTVTSTDVEALSELPVCLYHQHAISCYTADAWGSDSALNVNIFSFSNFRLSRKVGAG